MVQGEFSRAKYILVTLVPCTNVMDLLMKLLLNKCDLLFDSCDLSGVLEAQVRLVGTPLGLHGLPGGGGAAQAGLRSKGTLPREKSHHRGKANRTC